MNWRDVVIEELADEAARLRDERDGWRRVAMSGLDHIVALERELQMMDPERAVCRLRVGQVRSAIERQLDADAEVAA